MYIPEEVKESVASGQSVLFAGAGISKEVLENVDGPRLSYLLGKRIEKRYSDYDWRSRTFEQICDEFDVLFGRHKLVESIAKHIRLDAKPSDAHKKAVGLFRYIITTNWDRLFEEAYTAKGIYETATLYSETEAQGFEYKHRNLIKMHGCIKHNASIVCTTEQYERYAQKHDQMLDRVRDLIYDHPVIFIGYDFGDTHIHRLLYQIQQRRGVFHRKNYVVGPSFGRVRVRLLESKYKLEVIEATADEFMAGLPEPSIVYDATGDARKAREEIWKYVADIMKTVSPEAAFEMRRALNVYHLSNLFKGNQELIKWKHMLACVDAEYKPAEDSSTGNITEHDITNEFVAAVLRFQESTKPRYTDGILGPNTQQKLQREYDETRLVTRAST